MRNFVPHLSHHTELLRALLKKDFIVQWIKHANWSFEEIQTILAGLRRQKHPRRSKQSLDATDLDLLIIETVMKEKAVVLILE